MKQKYVVWKIALLLVGCATQTPDIPKDWVAYTMATCCKIALPPSASLEPLRDVIDDPSFILRGKDFEGILTITKMGTALPPPQSGSNYKKSQRQIDGRLAYVAAYGIDNKKGMLIEKRNLLWVFKGPNDGSGRNLLLDYTCSNQGCDDFDKMINTLKVTSK